MALLTANSNFCCFLDKFVITVRRSALHGLCDTCSNSVRLSVCLSHSWTVSTRFDLRSWFLHLMVAPSFYFWGCHVHPKIRRGHPERGRWMRVGWVRIGDFRPISRRISETVRDTTRLLLITNRKSLRAFDWYQNQRPWLTLKWPWTEIMHSLHSHVCFGANL